MLIIKIETICQYYIVTLLNTSRRYASADFEKMSDEILAIDEVMRYVGITDLKGSIVYNKMKKGKTSLKNQEQEIRDGNT